MKREVYVSVMGLLRLFDKPKEQRHTSGTFPEGKIVAEGICGCIFLESSFMFD
jgi:hypothetical protein